MYLFIYLSIFILIKYCLILSDTNKLGFNKQINT